MQRLLLNICHVFRVAPLHVLPDFQNSLGVFIVNPLMDGPPSFCFLLELLNELVCFDAVNDSCGGYAPYCCCVDSVVQSIFFPEHLPLAKLS